MNVQAWYTVVTLPFSGFITEVVAAEVFGRTGATSPFFFVAVVESKTRLKRFISTK